MLLLTSSLWIIDTNILKMIQNIYCLFKMLNKLDYIEERFYILRKEHESKCIYQLM